MIEEWRDGTVLPHLMSPTRIGSRAVKNRIVSPPHGTYFAAGGLVTDRQIAYYAERAAGGVGMIVAGNFAAWDRSKTGGAQNYAFAPEALEGHRRLAQTVQAHDALMVAQLWDGGRQGSSLQSRLPLLSASPLPDPVVRETPKQLEAFEIEEMIASFARSAGLMAEAGWDGVELLAAQGYGLAQFVSPQMNRRTDGWGGSHEGRARIVCEIVRRIRTAVPADFLVGVRINGDDMIPGGVTPADAVITARLLEQVGGVDYLNVSGASNENYPLWIADMSHDAGLFVSAAQMIKDAVSLPVMVATRVKDPLMAERLVADGEADLVGMNRALIADPTLPKKIADGRLSSAVPCISCNQGCVGRSAMGAAMSCTVNPRVGFEDIPFHGALPHRSVGVVGGGPAGLKAAVTVAEAGAEVVLFESGPRLGGQIELASRCASRAELHLIVEHLSRRLADLGVDVRLGVTATVADLRVFDHVLLAAGSRPLRTGFSTARPDVLALQGHDLPHVKSVWDVLEAPDLVGARVLVVEDEFQGQATTAAEFLAQHGRAVTVVSRSMSVGLWSGPNQEFLYKRLRRAGIELRPHTWISAIQDRGVHAYDVFAGDTVDLGEFDTVVLATGNVVNDDLYRQMSDDPRVVRIGDCLAPRRLDNAIWDGFHAVDHMTTVTRTADRVPS
ncbi:FAD-dependent oxidoreductase [Pseudonocardia kujensis]|uniref:oxidoreductase n=1 Tax=Pseudonocardia kujensis TaxID=1128675 RepID=UPI001E59924D|nr:FAD-dependent oxidoreductase [Pseudonocardia kujensis]MCE0765076.1 FAD-dependent oxidoreductase [Pseudonocardia kujensis]